MRSLRYTIELVNGVKAEMLFTPHLYSFKGTSGISFEADTTSEREVFELYADVMYCAALNAWVLDGRNEEDAPFRRSDFHEWMAAEPRAYGKALNFALVALTGKTIQDYLSGGENGAANAKQQADSEPIRKKKLFARLFGKK